MAEEKISVGQFLPEVKNKDFWERVPKIAYPAELLDLIGYYDTSKEALVVDKEGKITKTQVNTNNKSDIIIAHPKGKWEEKQFREIDKYLREMQMALLKIQDFRNPEELENWRKMIQDKEVVLFGEISAFFDKLRMRALRMALNEFNTTYTRERMILAERIREESTNE